MSPIFDLSLTLIMIFFFFWAIRPISFAKFMPYTPVQATFLKVMLAIIGGYLLSSFFISITQWVLQIPDAVLK